MARPAHRRRRARLISSGIAAVVVACFAVINKSAWTLTMFKEGLETINLLSPSPALVVIFDRAADALLASRVKLKNRMVVHRPKIALEIASYLETPSGHGYMVVVGPRGGGKSTAAMEAVKGRAGTIGILVKEGTDIYKAITGALYESEMITNATDILRTSNYEISNEKDLESVIMKAVDMRLPHDPSWRPTIVVEIDRGTLDVLVREVAKVFKRLTVDLEAAHVILVLSDGIAAFALPNDPDRQTLVWVDDFTPDEAVTYLDGRGCMLPAHDKTNAQPAHDKTNAQRRRELLMLGGTRPALLRKVCDILPAYREAHLSAKVSSATLDVEGLLWDGQTFSSDFGRLMCALLNATDLDGVPTSAARDYLAPPRTVVESFKRNHAVMFHMPTRTYRFHSPAHRQAARSVLSC
jgi:hypothetical protein